MGQPSVATEGPRGETRRNTKHGLRSQEAIETRKEKRTLKRWNDRREHRKAKGKTPGPPRGAQEPTARHKVKMAAGTTIKIATLNVRGMKQIGKREEIEKWMEAEGIEILGMQEPHITKNTKEKETIHMVLPWK